MSDRSFTRNKNRILYILNRTFQSLPLLLHFFYRFNNRKEYIPQYHYKIVKIINSLFNINFQRLVET